MSPSMIRRSQGTNEQNKAQAVRALAQYALRLQQKFPQMSAEIRMQMLRVAATR